MVTPPATDIDSITKRLQEPFDPRLLSWFPKVIKGDQGLAMAYIGSRHIMERLDKVVGPFGWQTGCKSEDSQLVKGVAIRNPNTGEWVWRWEPGQWEASQDRDRKVVEALGASTKGFRRAGMEWGIGRYLWFLEGFWVQMQDKKILKLPDIGQEKFWWALPYDHHVAKEKWLDRNGAPVKELGPDPDFPRAGTKVIIQDDGSTGESGVQYSASDILSFSIRYLKWDSKTAREWLEEHEAMEMSYNEMQGVLEEQHELMKAEEMQHG